jgi:CheY-like chemotaxis protein
MPGCSVLIVEDDPGSSESFAPMLSALGCEVRIACDASAGFLEVDRRMPTVMLVDLHLPVVDGLEFLRRLRSTPAYAAIPAALMTGDYLVDDRVTDAVQELGARLYFKPLWEEDLVAILQTLLAAAGEFSGGRGKVPTAAASD